MPTHDLTVEKTLKERITRWRTERISAVHRYSESMRRFKKVWELKSITREDWELFGKNEWVIYSKPFVVGERGCTCRLRVYPFGHNEGKDTHMSI